MARASTPRSATWRRSWRPTLLDPLPTERDRARPGRPAASGATSSPTRWARRSSARFADDTVRGVVAHRRADRHVRLAARPVAGPEPLLPLPPRSATAPASGGCRSAAWARSPTRSPGPRPRPAPRSSPRAGVERHPRPPTTAPRSPGTTATRAHTVDGPATCWPTSRPGCCGSCSARREDPAAKPEGSQLKINFLLDRLPRLKSGVDPAVAFAGTLHLAEDYSQLEAAYADAAAGRVPAALPGEVYCHSLTDPSILGDLPRRARTR